MNIIAICGSPRKGNTEFILRRFLAKAEELGHKTELVLLREKRIERCGGCLSCDESGECHVMDDMGAIMDRMHTNDLIVFGSPNYFNNVTGLTKDFFDRLNPFYENQKLSGKQAIAIFAGDEMKSADKIRTVVESITNSLGINMIGDFYLNGRDSQDVEKNPENIQKIDDFAKSILS